MNQPELCHDCREAFAQVMTGPHRRCTYCGTPFATPVAYGPRPRYCPTHREAHYRKRVQRAKDLRE